MKLSAVFGVLASIFFITSASTHAQTSFDTSPAPSPSQSQQTSTSPPPPTQASHPLAEQPSAATYYHNGIWESGVFAGGGEGLGSSDATQFFNFGVRAGTVLFNDHGQGVWRGNFEYAAEFMPVYEVLAEDEVTGANDNIYGVSIKPVVLRWNFTGAKRFSPFIQLAGGLLFTTHDVPPEVGPHHTSWVNFTPQGGLGVNIFTRPGQAVVIQADLVHHSNANLGSFNPGYNSAFFFTFGYSWIHRWREK